MKQSLTAAAIVLTLTFGGGAYAYLDDDLSEYNGQHSENAHEKLGKLPKDSAALVQRVMKTALEDNKNLMLQSKRLHRDLRIILSADSFSEQDFNAKQTAIQQLHDKIRKNISMAFTSALAQLSVDDRKIIADEMAQHDDGWRRA
jgi:uncharacterized membrane protein